MATAGIQLKLLKLLNVMRKYRRIVRTPNSKLQSHQIILMALIVNLFISIVLSILYFKLNIHMFYTIMCIVYIILLLLFLLFIIFLKKREQVSTLNIEDMNKKSSKVANGIRNLFNDKNITDVLKLSNSTRYGQEMPEIYVYIDESLIEGYIAIENISNWERVDKESFEQRVSGILAGRYQKYAIVSSELTHGDSFILFHFEDTQTPQRIVIKDTKFLNVFTSKNKHHIRLAKDLIWKADITSNFSIIARTRAGKSVLAGNYMARLMLLQGWIVEYNSAKYDRYVKEFNGISDPIKIVERAEYWCEVMDYRLEEINLAGKDKYLEMDNMNDIAVFFDELGNLNASLEALDKIDKHLNITARWTTAINRLSATGASAGIHIIAISQFATKEGFLPSLARVNCSDAVIMLGGAADSPTERQYLMSGFSDMPRRSYKKGQGLAKINGSGRKWENSPHFYETPWFESL